MEKMERESMTEHVLPQYETAELKCGLHIEQLIKKSYLVSNALSNMPTRKSQV